MINTFKKVLLISSLLLLLSPIQLLASDKAKDVIKDGNELLNDGRYKDAINYYDQAIESDPNYIDAYIYKGVALWALQEYQDAIDILNKAVQIAPDVMNQDVVFGDNFKVYFIIADSYFRLKKYDNVIKQFQLVSDDKSINVDDYILWLRLMAYQLNNINQYQYALQLYNLPFIVQQNNPEVYCDKADSYFGLKQYDDVIKQFQLAAKCLSLKIDNYLYSLQGMSSKLMEIKQYQYAISLYDLALLKQSNNGDIKEARDKAQTEFELYKDKGSK